MNGQFRWFPSLPLAVREEGAEKRRGARLVEQERRSARWSFDLFAEPIGGVGDASPAAEPQQAPERRSTSGQRLRAWGHGVRRDAPPPPPLAARRPGSPAARRSFAASLPPTLQIPTRITRERSQGEVPCQRRRRLRHARVLRRHVSAVAKAARRQRLALEVGFDEGLTRIDDDR